MHEGDRVGKRLTKTQQKRMYESILSKTMKSWSEGNLPLDMSTNDMIAIEKICMKYLKKFWCDYVPLPNAEKKSRRVYAVNQTTDLENMTFDTNIKETGQVISIEEMNEDELRRLVLVNLARLTVKGEWDGLIGWLNATTWCT